MIGTRWRLAVVDWWFVTDGGCVVQVIGDWLPRYFQDDGLGVVDPMPRYFLGMECGRWSVVISVW